MGWRGSTMSESDRQQLPGPEHQEKNQVSRWLEKHGGDVWWEQANPWDYPTFHIERGEHRVQSKPDLVVEIDGIAIAAEFKPKVSKSNIYDALLQLHGYWFNHTVHDQVYVCGGSAVEIEGFVTATGNSIVGHLFDGGYEEALTTEDFGQGRINAIKRGKLPAQEWTMTEQHVRQLWRVRKDALEKNDHLTDVPASGALLSTMLDGDADPKPAVLWDTDSGENWRILA